MTSSARLIDVAIPRHPEGIVLVLHGGDKRAEPMGVTTSQPPALRMVPIAWQLRRAGGGRLAVLRLLNSWRGWDAPPGPVADAAWALAQVAERFGSELPVCLVGHSLGGRAALLSAGAAQVRGVVALAPWVAVDEPCAEVSGTPIVIIHGDGDEVALPERSHALARRLAERTPVSYVTVRGGSHAMLRHRRSFDGLAARCAAWMLLGESADPLVARIAAGERELVV